MKTHEFTLVLPVDPTEEDAERMYRTISDGTIITTAGTPQVHFHRESASLEDAIRSAIADVRTSGFDVARVEIEPSDILQAS